MGEEIGSDSEEWIVLNRCSIRRSVDQNTIDRVVVGRYSLSHRVVDRVNR